MKSSSWILLGALLAGGNGMAPQGVAHSADDLEGSAFVDEGVTLEWVAWHEAQVEAAEAYVACLRSAEASNWFGKTDFAPCDKAREAYVAYLAEDVADDVVGCLEVGALGAARTAESPCEGLRERFPASYAEMGGAP